MAGTTSRFFPQLHDATEMAGATEQKSI